MNPGIALSLKGVDFRYPGAAFDTLSGLDLDIRAGEWITILGANGSGKSTLMKLLNALLIPTQGFCFVDGVKTSSPSFVEEIRAKVSIVFQNPDDQIVAAVVEEDTAFGPENLGLPPLEIQSRVTDALKSVGLGDRMKHPVSALSGGQKQRLALAGALAIGPQALLLDEAMSMLDPLARKNFLSLIKREHERGLTIISITHRPEEIINSERVIALRSGRIIWDGATDAFLSLDENEMRAMNFRKPKIIALKDELVRMKVLSCDIKPTVQALTEELCR